jgi:hypothetical protein
MLGWYDANKTVLLVNQDSNHPSLASLTLAPALTGGGDQTIGTASVDRDRHVGAGVGGDAGVGEQGLRTSAMMEVDPVSGLVRPALDDAPFMPGFQVELLAGDARLFTWVAGARG